VRSEQQWKVTDRALLNYSESNLPHCHVLKQKSHIHHPGIEDPPRYL